MNTGKISTIIFTLLLSITAISPAWAKKDLPAVNDDRLG